MSSSDVSTKAKSNTKYASLQTATVLTTDASVHETTTIHATACPVEIHTDADHDGHVHVVPSSTFNVETTTTPTEEFVKGEVQPPAYRDVWFGVFFLCHLATMVVVTVMYATGTLKTSALSSSSSSIIISDADNGTTDDGDVNYVEGDDAVGEDGGNRDRILEVVAWQKRFMAQQYSSFSPTSSSSSSSSWEDEQTDEWDHAAMNVNRILLSLVASLIFAPLLAIIAMKFMKTHGIQLIQSSLYFAIGFNIVMGALIVATGGGGASIFSFLFAAILWCYAKAIWHRIPFAAANLKAAITCIQSNGGMTFLGFLKIPVLTVWTLMWSFVFSCVMNSPWMLSQESLDVVTDDYMYGRPNVHESEGVDTIGTVAIMGLLLSLYWTFQVVHNTVHTTLAGTVGTWWFQPAEARSCCSPGLADSLCRSLTYSFGSICFGSLLVAIIEVIRSMVRSAANNRRGGIVTCIAQCLLHYIEQIAQYFNKFAFIYVGLYGYAYLEAGKNVFSLFKHRGFTVIINDGLVGRMLGMVCFCIGLINSCIAAVLALGADGGVVATSALIGFFAGVILSLMVANVLISTTDSIIVLYAEAPREFETNHPALAQEMHDTWSQAWPDIFTRNSDSPAVATPV